MSQLPAYIFVRLDQLKAQAQNAGIDVIDLGLGNPDSPTPPAIIEALKESLKDPKVHGYPPFAGHPDFKQAIVDQMLRWYQVVLDPQTEVLPLLGSKEGLAHLSMAFLNKDDVCLVPNPCYPVHIRGPILAGANIYELPLTAENQFLPDLDAIASDVAGRAKILILNYPNNPTGAVAPLSFLEKAVAFCRKHNILLVHDLAYGQLYLDNQKPHSILQIPQAKEVAVEFHTLSKSYNMAGWRLGYAVGNPQIIQTLYTFKTNLDYGIFGAIQKAGVTALGLPDAPLEQLRTTYRKRSQLLCESLRSMNYSVSTPKATMYIWLPLPSQLHMSSSEFAETLLAKAGVVVTPGVAFGKYGEGYVRISMVATEARLQEAMDRWRAAKF
jgi:LL-diaminopimelate aminotransferase